MKETNELLDSLGDIGRPLAAELFAVGDGHVLDWINENIVSVD